MIQKYYYDKSINKSELSKISKKGLILATVVSAVLNSMAASLYLALLEYKK